MSLWDIHNLSILIPFVLIPLVGLFALFKCRSDKKSFFILLVFAAFIYILGHLLELFSTNTGEALMAIRVAKLGCGLSVLFGVFFVFEYCETKCPNIFKMCLCLATALYIIGIWTTDKTGFFFLNLELDPSAGNRPVYTPGTLFWLFSLFYLLCFLIALAVILRKIAGSEGDYKKTLLLAMTALFLPCFTELLESGLVAAGFSAPMIFLTPYAYGVSAVLFFIALRKYDMLDKSPLSSLQAMNTISHAVILLDDNLCFISSNGAANALFPWLKTYRTGEAIYYSPNWPAALSHNAFGDGEFSVDFATHDSSRYYHATAFPFHSDLSRKKHWSIMIQDITDSEQFVKKLEEAAYTDTLTGLYNRRHFAEIAMPFIERAKRSEMPYYIMMADLDFFKDVNDKHGHLAGDAVLRHVALIMKSTVRSYDIVARWGGEEFIFLITDSTTDDVTALAERIRYAIESTPCDYSGKRLPISISFGIAQSGNDDIEMTDLILRADEALYKSKQNGRNCVTLWTAS